jgi:cyclic pyranopterin phosphate synthase
MRDSFNREVDYLRISVTDLCNLRCVYCMPEKGVEKFSHDQIITPERIKEIVEASAKLGIKKIRLTGGEPLTRHGLIEIIKFIKQVKGIEEICLTTNGIGLKEKAQELFDAGVTRLNISLDTLDEKKYRFITRGGNLSSVLEGIKEAQKVGFKNTKINCVLIGGFNDDEIKNFKEFSEIFDVTIRFIELMPIGEGANFDKKSYISNKVILEKLPGAIFDVSDGVTTYYKFENSNAKIGLISPLSNKFCESCSRIRLTSDGKIKPCLHSKAEFDLSGLHCKDLEEKIKESILAKPKEHYLNEDGKSNSIRGMSKIGG